MSSSEFRGTLQLACAKALSHLEGLEQTPVGATVNLATLRQRFDHALPEEGMAAEDVIAELTRDVEGGLIGCAGGRFFAWVIGGALPAALAADWLTSTWDQNATLYASGQAAAVIEETVGKWLKDILGLPETASFALVTGCQMSHVTCLAAARHAVMQQHGWDVEERGLFGAPPIRVLASRERHGTLERALRILGLGRGCLVDLPGGVDGKVSAGTLRAALDGVGDGPAIVALQAGDLNTGAYDDFSSLIPTAQERGAWVHVDGAFGLWAAASPQFRYLLRGVELADSWATDGHKWLNVPYDCGYAFVARPEAHRAALSHREPYLIHATEVRDALDYTPEWSRRARSFPTYAALRQLGRTGVADLVDGCCAHAKALVRGMGALGGVEVLCEPLINQGLVRFLDPRGTDHDQRTDHVVAEVVRSGEAFFGATTWHGQRAMRVSVSNWQTTERDVARAIAAVSGVLSAGE